MKRINIMITMLVLSVVLMNAQVYMGDWLHKFQQGNRIDYTPIHFYSEKKHYVQGGILFTFPLDYFTLSPHVYVSIELDNTDYAPDLEFNALITELSPLLVKVNVNKVNTGIIHNFSTEADTEDIIVHIFACGY